MKEFAMGHSRFNSDTGILIKIFNKLIKFYVIEDDFPIIEDGIIGLPCLSEFKFELSNDKLKLNDNILILQKEPLLQSGKILVQIVYFERRLTQTCFVNGGKSAIQISNIEKSNDISQIKIFKELVRLSHIEPNLREPIEKLLLFYLDVFNLETELLLCTNLTEHTITLKENKIVQTTRMPQRRN